MRYIADAPLRRLTDVYMAQRSDDALAVPSDSIPLMDITEAALPYAADEAVELAAAMIEDAETVPLTFSSGKFVHNRDTNFVHIVAKTPAMAATDLGTSQLRLGLQGPRRMSITNDHSGCSTMRQMCSPQRVARDCLGGTSGYRF